MKRSDEKLKKKKRGEIETLKTVFIFLAFRFYTSQIFKFLGSLFHSVVDTNGLNDRVDDNSDDGTFFC